MPSYYNPMTGQIETLTERYEREALVDAEIEKRIGRGEREKAAEMSSHEPVFVVGKPWGNGTWIVFGCEDPHAGKFFADCETPDGDDFQAAQERARRIVACVNACAGIPIETLEAVSTDRQFWPLDLEGSSRKGLITLLGIQNFTVQGLKKQADSETRKKLKTQRDELLAALEKFLDDNNPEGFGCACEPGRLCGPCSEAKRQRPLYAAIASVKEKRNGSD